MVSFVHTADIHFDTPFSARFSPKQAELRRREVMGAFRRIAERAAEADLFLLSGDLFDSQFVSQDTVAFLKRCFREMPRTQVFVAAGNHDPLTQDSVYLRETWPENVHIFGTELSYVDLPRLTLRVHGVSFGGPRQETALLRPLPLAGDGWCNLLVIHGDLTAEGGQSVYNPIWRSALEGCGADYAALGHIHKATQLLRAGQTYYAYPGIPEGRGFDEDGPKGYFAGEAEKGQVRVQWIPVASRCFRHVRADVSALEDSIQVMEAAAVAMEEAGTPEDIYRIILTGQARPGLVQPEALREQLKGQAFYLEVRDQTRPGRSLKELAEEPGLRGAFAAAMLQRIAAMPPEEQELGRLAAQIGIEAMEGGGGK